MLIDQAYVAIRQAAEAFERELNRHNLDLRIIHSRIDVTGITDEQQQFRHEINVVVTQRIK